MKAATASGRGPIHWFYTVHLWGGIILVLLLLLWTGRGLFITSNAIEVVRGDTLRREVPPVDLGSAGPLLSVLSGIALNVVHFRRRRR